MTTAFINYSTLTGNPAILTWCVVAALSIALLGAKLLMPLFRQARRHKVISLGDEREEIYAPGDVLPCDTRFYDSDDDL